MHNTYSYEKITDANQQEAFSIYLANAEYFALTKEIPHIEQIKADATSLPPGLDSTHKHFVLVRYNGESVVVLDLLTDYPEEHEAFLGLLLVKEKGLGHGGEILQLLEEQLATHGYTSLALAVLQNNHPGLTFWRKMDFKEIGNGIFSVADRNYPVVKFAKKLI